MTERMHPKENQRHTQSESKRPTLKQRFAKLLKTEYDYERPRRGEVREATIVAFGDLDLLVDLGGKRDGVIPPKDLEFVDQAYLDNLKVGDSVPVVIHRTWPGEPIVVSLNRGLQQQDWIRAQHLWENGRVFEAKVVEANRGGVLIQFGRLRGFVPNSHLTSLPRGLSGQKRKERKTELIGKTLSLAVIEVKQQRRRLVFSERVASRRQRQKLLDELIEGEIRTGIVTSLVDFGVFVDLGGIDGLIHISELAWHHVDDPRDVLGVGDEVEVYVLDVDRERERIGLSRKRLLPDPWHEVTDKLEEGQIVQAAVSNIAPFGVFIDLGHGIDGLLHNSEIPNAREAIETLEPGMPITVRVLDINQDKRRIGLSLWGVERTAAFRGDDIVSLENLSEEWPSSVLNVAGSEQVVEASS
jgi:small subunit ribosomal protein S1